MMKKSLPITNNIGKITPNIAYFYGLKEIAIANDAVLYVDIEQPQEEYRAMKETEIHFGISGNWHFQRRYGNVKPHLDLYLSLSEFMELCRIINHIKVKLAF